MNYNFDENEFEDEETKIFEDCMNDLENSNHLNFLYQPKPDSKSSNQIISKDQITDLKTITKANEQIETKTNELINYQTFNKYIIEEHKKIKPKNKNSLSNKELQFKEDFYSIFLNNIKGKKIIPKEKVILIHNSICKEAGVRKMRRNEYRAINNYFKHFAKFQCQIIKSIIQNKERLSELIGLPSIIQRATEITESRKQKAINEAKSNNK